MAILLPNPEILGDLRPINIFVLLASKAPHRASTSYLDVLLSFDRSTTVLMLEFQLI